MCRGEGFVEITNDKIGAVGDAFSSCIIGSVVVMVITMMLVIVKTSKKY